MERVFEPLIVTDVEVPIKRLRQFDAAVICGMLAAPKEIETSVVASGTAFEHQLEAVFQLDVVPSQPPAECIVILTGTVVPVQPLTVTALLNQVVCVKVPGV